MTGAAGRGPEGEAHPLQHPWVVARRLHALDVDSEIGQAKAFRGRNDAVGQDVADILAGGDLYDQGRQLVGVAVVDVVVEPPLFFRLHHQGAEVADGDGVHAETVGEVVQVGDLLHFGDHAEAAEGVDGLVFRPLQLQVLVPPFFEPSHPAAGHEAFGAGVGLDLVFLMVALAAELVPVFHRPLVPVFGWEGPGGIHQSDHHRGAEALVGLDAGMLHISL
ncbi:MAG: hypothetical protein ACD_75C02236G0001 [uncultured bacterium]|nr:MAG: hypothetical protein ACD_75C02236G0001 [uncultured bacterium]